MRTITLRPGSGARGQANMWNGLRSLSGCDTIPTCSDCGGFTTGELGGPSSGLCLCNEDTWTIRIGGEIEVVVDPTPKAKANLIARARRVLKRCKKSVTYDGKRYWRRAIEVRPTVLHRDGNRTKHVLYDYVRDLDTKVITRTEVGTSWRKNKTNG